MDDDFGAGPPWPELRRGGEEPRRSFAARSARPARPRKPTVQLDAEHLLDFEAMKAVPDQLVSYFFWAEDIGPDGQPRAPRATCSSPRSGRFDQIFRQGEQPPGGSAEKEGQEGSQNAQEAGQLAELQKQIINATWKLIRRETATKPSDAFAEDAKALRESQKAVIEQAGQMAERSATSRRRPASSRR